MSGDNPWIEWAGGKCPVRNGTPVDVKYRDGGIVKNAPANEWVSKAWRDADARFWTHDGHHSDIIAYRLVSA